MCTNSPARRPVTCAIIIVSMAQLAMLNDDEKSNLVAVMWIGRDSFAPEELELAKRQAIEEATAPTEDYLSGIPALGEYLESGMEMLGIDVSDEEDDL